MFFYDENAHIMCHNVDLLVLSSEF
jgi:hypothetical protein